jgi:hypothetical protein
MHAWSAATPAGVTADVVIIRRQSVDSAGLCAGSGIKGKLVLTSMPQATCRPDSDNAPGALGCYHRPLASRYRRRRLVRGSRGGHRPRAPCPARARRCGWCTSNSWSSAGAWTDPSRGCVPSRRSTCPAGYTPSRGWLPTASIPRPRRGRGDGRADRVAVFNTIANSDQRSPMSMSCCRPISTRGRRERRDGQRHGHNHHARGPAHSGCLSAFKRTILVVLER